MKYFVQFTVIVLFILGCLSFSNQVAIAGNLFMGSWYGNAIYEFTPSGQQSTFASGLNGVNGLVFDRNGNLFEADSRSGNIYKFTPTGNRSTFASGLTFPKSLAFDASENLIAVDLGNSGSGAVYKFTPSGQRSTIASGMSEPAGLAIDQNGNIFVSDVITRCIYKFPPSGSTSIFANGLNFPASLAFDSSGNLFAGDSPSIYKFTPTGTKTTFATGLLPAFITFDADGNLFETDYYGVINKFTPSGIKSTFVSGLRGNGDPSGLAFSPVPEPTSLALLGMGGIGLIAYGWRRRTAHRILVGFIALLVSTAGVASAADVFNMPAGQTSLEFVNVGDSGNAPDTTGFGSVDYTYQMGKYDVTVGQYCQFLNAVAKTDTHGLYNSWMAAYYPTIRVSRSGSSGNYNYAVTGSYSQAVNCPAFFVSWGSAARFCNWLQNGQPTGAQGNGTTETGAYTLNGAVTSSALMAINRNPEATYVIPSENEWYKAAYYKSGGTNAGYWRYPTQSNSRPANIFSSTAPNHANFYFYDEWDPNNNNGGYTDRTNYLTPVGAFAASAGPYGTYDMCGNVFQWNETAVGSLNRGLRGGAFDCEGGFASSDRGYHIPTENYSASIGYSFGFRVASVPEPSTLALLGMGGIGLIAWGWRRRKTHRIVVCFIALLVSTEGMASADVFNMGGTRNPATGVWTGQASLEFVTVGDAGNAADTTGYGAVGYNYQMGKYDVTAGQYAAFLNAVATTSDPFRLYDFDMAPGSFGACGIRQNFSAGVYSYSVDAVHANYPVNFITWGTAARFCNWLHNGQPIGPEGPNTTDNGAYTLKGLQDYDLTNVPRNANAIYCIPTENEWYKAAYYKSGGTNAGYWSYATQNNSLPGNVLSPSASNSANYCRNGVYTDPVNHLTPVGAFFESPGPYGTYDLNGDLWQWTETPMPYGWHNIRGGAWTRPADVMVSTYRVPAGTFYGMDSIGFRVASVPEPGSLAMLLSIAVGGLIFWKRRKA